ncbi:hypothetical protein [Rhizobium sp.]|uniref:hypothetical protein n=1 Tax=Rhizobium sp. TaxID=391 RepID=UPI0028A5C0D5
MPFKLAAFGHHIEIDSRLPHALYVFTSRHEFAWSRTEWFEQPCGKWRHWVIEKRLGSGSKDTDALMLEIQQYGETRPEVTAG